MTNKNLILVLLAFLLITCRSPIATYTHSSGQTPLTRIAFGSCNRENKPQPMWQYIVQNRPQLWIWMGDNVYGDTHDMEVLKQKYVLQKNNLAYQKLTASTPVIGIWDDHDYGINDGGKYYAKKQESQQLMLDFLDVPTDSERRSREGAYGAYTYGPEGRQIKVILLDTRYFRDTLMQVNKEYVLNKNGEILGETQWRWLEQELTNSKANIHLIAGGIQMIPEEHIYEKWANFPRELERLLKLIASTRVKGVILLSGDRHIAEISRYTSPEIAYPLYEVTASGLTHSATQNTGEANRHRVGKLINVLNFGFMTINWDTQPLEVGLEIRGMDNQLLQEAQIMIQ
jgi:alkaline phosphatase D